LFGRAHSITEAQCCEVLTIKCYTYPKVNFRGRKRMQDPLSAKDNEIPPRLNEIEGTRQGLELVSDKWTVLVVYSLKYGPRRLSELQRNIQGISQKMLIQTLRKLEQYGLVDRKVYPVVPPKVEYSLTPLGMTLIKPLYAICDWTADHIAQMQTASEKFAEQRQTKEL
jgi:Predicted transcriptional regulators